MNRHFVYSDEKGKREGRNEETPASRCAANGGRRGRGKREETTLKIQIKSSCFRRGFYIVLKEGGGKGKGGRREKASGTFFTPPFL